MNDSIWFWVLIFSIPIVSIVAGSFERISRNRTLARLAESGKPIPPELLSGIRGRHGRAANLRGGIVTTFAGLGIVLMFWAMTGASGVIPGMVPLMPPEMGWLPAAGIIPFMVGIGMIVASIFQKNGSDQ